MKYKKVVYDINAQNESCCDLCVHWHNIKLCRIQDCIDETPEGQFIDHYFIEEKGEEEK